MLHVNSASWIVCSLHWFLTVWLLRPRFCEKQDKEGLSSEFCHGESYEMLLFHYFFLYYSSTLWKFPGLGKCKDKTWTEAHWDIHYFLLLQSGHGQPGLSLTVACCRPFLLPLIPTCWHRLISLQSKVPMGPSLACNKLQTSPKSCFLPAETYAKTLSFWNLHYNISWPFRKTPLLTECSYKILSHKLWKLFGDYKILTTTPTCIIHQK